MGLTLVIKQKFFLTFITQSSLVLVESRAFEVTMKQSKSLI